MIDDEVRELGRRARADDDPGARLAWLVARVRAGLPRERVILAAWAGDAAARALLGKAAPPASRGPLHLARKPVTRPWIAVMTNAGKAACVDAACDALEAACTAASSPHGAGVVAACRAWRAAGDRVAAKLRHQALAVEVATTSQQARLDAATLQRLLAEAEPQAWRRNPALAMAAAPAVSRPVLVGLSGALLAEIVGDAGHRFAVLAAIVVRLATALAAGVAPASPVDAAVRAAVIRFALR